MKTFRTAKFCMLPFSAASRLFGKQCAANSLLMQDAGITHLRLRNTGGALRKTWCADVAGMAHQRRGEKGTLNGSMLGLAIAAFCWRGASRQGSVANGGGFANVF